MHRLVVDGCVATSDVWAMYIVQFYLRLPRRSLSRSARSVKEDLGDPRLEALDEMAAYMYDYLSGGNSLDYDLYL